MMDWTDRHCRFFHRLLSPSAVLYTEMVTAAALTHGDSQRLLHFNAAEQPVVLQIGGSDPALMAEAARLGELAGYSAININVGCPSERVQSGSFGACLMAEPALVSACFRAMTDAVAIPVTVKTRIGIDSFDSDEFFERFVLTLADAGCTQFDVHARIAILKGLSPKQNRTVPPLNYARVYGLKARHPALRIVINGGIDSIDRARGHLEHVDGVMIGREAYHNPWSLTGFEALCRTDPWSPPSRADVVAAMADYAALELAKGAQLKHITRHMLGLFAGLPGARAWRRTLSEQAHRDGADPRLLEQALRARDARAA